MADEKAPEKKGTIEERVDALEDVTAELIGMMEGFAKDVAAAQKAAAAASKAKGLFGGKREQTPTKDLMTGKVYISKAAVGKAFASEVGLEPTNHFAWYRVYSQLRMKDNSPRFADASVEEAEKIRAEVKAEMEKLEREAMAKMEAEEKATAAKEAGAKPAGQPAPAPVKQHPGRPGQSQRK